MKQQYVLCSRDNESNNLVYYTGTMTYNGSLYYGNVLEAKRFDSMKEVAELIMEKGDGEFYLGINVIGIADVTFEAIANNKELFEKFHDPNYAIR